MNESDSGPPKGARPKAKPIAVVSNGVEPSCSENNNSRRSLYVDDNLVNNRLSIDDSELDLSSRPCGSGIEGPSRPGCSTEMNDRWSLQENGQIPSSSQTSDNTSSIQVQRPSNLPLNGFSSSDHSSSLPLDEDSLDGNEFSVLPRRLLQDYCGLNGECDLCGSQSVQLPADSLNRLDANSASANGQSGDAKVQDNVNLPVQQEEGAVGGQDAALEAGRCSPDSGEGEFENQNSRSPSCSWDQQSSSSAEECFYRYRGEDDAQRNPAVNENIPNRVDGENDARRRSSSPEMDYLEMDFDPSSSDWGGDDARPPGPVVPELPLLEPAPPTPPPLPVPQVVNTEPPQLDRTPPPVEEPEAPVVAITRSNIMLWSQSFASELTHPFTTPLTSASNAIFYTMTALGHQISRESVISHLTETYPPQSIPQTVVAYLMHRASHTNPSTFSLILTGLDLARTIRVISQGQLCARFFPIVSRQLLESGNLCSYIITWLHRGVVPILTFSQASSEGSRHEMVFGSSEGGILTMGEPYRTLGEAALSMRLSGQGRVVVPHSEVLARWSRDQNLRPLMQPPTIAWISQNILGSVVGMLRDAAAPPASPSPSSPCTSRQPQPQPALHLPLLCESGITLVCTTSNPCYHLLETCTNFNH